jgi:hypothetical protein
MSTYLECVNSFPRSIQIIHEMHLFGFVIVVIVRVGACLRKFELRLERLSIRVWMESQNRYSAIASASRDEMNNEWLKNWCRLGGFGLLHTVVMCTLLYWYQHK